VAQAYEMQFAVPNYLFQILLQHQNLNPKLQKIIARCVDFFITAVPIVMKQPKEMRHCQCLSLIFHTWNSHNNTPNMDN
jgi:hypothetical protein